MTTKPSDYHRIRKAFQIAVGILASRAYGCGACPPPGEYTEVYTSPANGPDGGDVTGALPTLDQATCDRLCGGPTTGCAYASTDASGAVVIRCYDINRCGGAGRRPDGWVAARVDGADALGVWLGAIADLEAASVDAFRILEHELGVHGAPASLRRRARAAAADEIRHARTMRRLARRRGATVQRRTKMGPLRSRTLLEIAIENAVEGCVRETFAALVAEVQAARATDADLRDALRTIAKDETRHAALAHAVRAFLDSKLSTDERAAVDRAHREALARLADEAPVFLGDSARMAAGLPEASELRALARSLAASLADGAGIVSARAA